MNTELLGVIAMYGLTLVLAIPLGRYIARIYKCEKHWSDFLLPLERAIYRLAGVDATKEMTWKQHLKALLTINLVWFVYGFFALIFQDKLPLNPDGNAGQTPDLAFNTVISFVVNCNLQHYSGESGLTYFTQLFVVMFFQFVSAATGMAALAAVFKAMAPGAGAHCSPLLGRGAGGEALGNFWMHFTRSITRILMPLSLVVAFILAVRGTPMTFDGRSTVTTLEGTEQQITQGPAAGMVAIKQLGTNGGGFFGVNSSHPLENPDYLTNMVESIAILLIPIALVFAFGFYLNNRRLSWTVFGVMTMGFALFATGSILAERAGNPSITAMGIEQPMGSMEGKEVRFGAEASAFWGIATTATSNGSVNAMHDSMTPLSGALQMLDMMINAFYGGVGVGFLNYYIFIIIGVFIAGLMVGRTPELLGRKVEAREVKIATLIALLHPFLILVATAIASYTNTHHGDAAWTVQPANWLNNRGAHGFSEMLYENTSAAANNGSGFEGLGDNNFFWNFLTGLVLILGRYLPIIGPLAIAGLLAAKKVVPAGGGTLRTDTATFGALTFALIFILAALSFFPALALGPLAEYFSM
ncbi:MAG: potassium-transporting ATPase subunit KdpA [Flavobacteriales bacterium]|nr:MAG: potassium-transporting ATPase subunit KdpA [Flavobacteriales bacterium]